MKEFEKELGVIRPSTGTSAILWALKNFNKVIIHGFDFFIDSKSHYYENIFFKIMIDIGIINKGGKHDMISEKKYVENLIDDKKITLLTEHYK